MSYVFEDSHIKMFHTAIIRKASLTGSSTESECSVWPNTPIVLYQLQFYNWISIGERTSGSGQSSDCNRHKLLLRVYPSENSVVYSLGNTDPQRRSDALTY